MATVSLSPIFNGYQSFLATGLPNSFGFIKTYAAGSSTPLATYSDSSGIAQNPVAIPLNASGYPPNQIWLDATLSYKFVITDTNSNVIGTFDNIVGYQSLNVFSASNGASLVGFIASGAGSVATNTAQKLQQYQSVLDNMTAAQIADVIAGTGAVDMTAAIQAAHDKLPATGGTIDFPLPGLYLLATDGIYVNITKPNVLIRGCPGAWVVNPNSANAEITTGTRVLNGFIVTGNNCTISVNMRGCANVWNAAAATDRLTMMNMKMLNLYNAGLAIGSTPFDTLDVLNVEFNTSRDLASDPGNYEAIQRSCNGNVANYGKRVNVQASLFKGVSGGIDVHNVKDVVVGGGTRFEGVDGPSIKLTTLDLVVVPQNLTVDETVTFDGAALNPASANRHLNCTGAGRTVPNYSFYLGFIQVFDNVKFHGKAYNFANSGMAFLNGTYIDAVINFDGAEFVDCTNAIVDAQGTISMQGMQLTRSNIYHTSISTVRSQKFNHNRMIDSYAAFTKKSVAVWSPMEALDNIADYSINNLGALRFVNYGTDNGPAMLFDRNIVNITGVGNTLAIDGGMTGTLAFIGASNIITAAGGTPTTNGYRLTAFEPQTVAYTGSIDFPHRNGEITVVNTNSTGAITYVLTAATSTKLPVGTRFRAVKTNNANAFAFSDAVANSINGAFTSVTFGSAYASAVFEKIGTDAWSVTAMSGTVTLA